MKNNEACGWDMISAEVLKAGGDIINLMLLKLMTQLGLREATKRLDKG